MESIGQKLKTAREEKGYSPDQVARDTNIARRFIVAMEEEDFAVFPGDTYLLGFLRNYADYLGLDAERIVNLYRNMKIQEQPIPMEELLQGKKKKPGMGLILMIVAAILVLGGGGFGIYTIVSSGALTAGEEQNNEPADEIGADGSGEGYVMAEEIVARRFSEGQEITVDLGDRSVSFTIGSVGEKVLLDTPAGQVEVGLGRTVPLDLTLDGRDDLAVELQDVDTGGRTVVLRLDRGVGNIGTINKADTGGERIVGETNLSPGTTSVEDRKQTPLVITEAEQPEPFRLDVTFRGYSLFRYLKDGEIRDQKYFNKDDTFRLDVTRDVMLWISNAGSFQARIAGREVDFGGPGVVATKLVRWEEDNETGRYQLKLLPVY